MASPIDFLAVDVLRIIILELFFVGGYDFMNQRFHFLQEISDLGITVNMHFFLFSLVQVLFTAWPLLGTRLRIKP